MKPKFNFGPNKCSYTLLIEDSPAEGYLVRLSIVERGTGDSFFIDLTKDLSVVLADDVLKRVNASEGKP